jgi:hypothetical protein
MQLAATKLGVYWSLPVCVLTNNKSKIRRKTIMETKDIKVSEIDHRKSGEFGVVVIDLRPIIKNKAPEFATLRKQLIDEAFSIQADVDRETERFTKSTIESLDAEHEMAVARCKDANSDLETMRNQQFRYEQKSRDLDKALTLAHLNLKVAHGSKPNPSFMLKSDVAAYEADVAAKQAEVETILGKMRSAELELQSYLSSCEAKRQELLKSMAEEQNLRLRLERLRGENLAPVRTALGLAV